MAQAAVINGVTYPSVEAVALAGDDGNTTVYYPDAVRYAPQTLTEAQKAQARENVGAISLSELSEELAKRGQLKPEFANSVDECTDTAKLYVLPDGYIYAYLKTEVATEETPNFTNVLPLAVDSDGSPYNGGLGYKVGYRLNSSGVEVVAETNCCTGFIPVKNTDTVRFINIIPHASSNGYIHFYDSSFNLTAGKGYEGWTADQFEFVPASLADMYPSWGNAPAGAVYMRISSGTISDETIITLNEEITYSPAETITQYQWVNTGHAFVPANYEDRIIAVEEQSASNTSRIDDLETAVEDGLSAALTDDEKLAKIKAWDKPVYDYSAVTLLGDERAKAALATEDLTVEAVYAKFRALMAKYPRYITETNLGPCTASDAFEAVDVLRFDFREPDGLVESERYTVNETKPKIIFMTGVHREWAGIYGLYYALEEIAENPEFDDIRRNAHIIVVPCSNPHCLNYTTAVDGWTMSHVNANGVAIHNNFGVEHNTYNAGAAVGAFNYGGTEPYSELETQYIDTLMSENSDAIAFVSCHNFNYSQSLPLAGMAIWASSATAYMCNLAFRLVDKISKAWHNQYGDALKTEIDTHKDTTWPEGEYRLGFAQFSTSAGTEQLNATKYGIQATNLEISDNMKVLFSEAQYSAETMTHGAEVYANYMRIVLGAYSYTDKEAYYK